MFVGRVEKSGGPFGKDWGGREWCGGGRREGWYMVDGLSVWEKELSFFVNRNIRVLEVVGLGVGE